VKVNLKFIYVLLAGAVVSATVIFSLEQVKARPDFCVSCHLENGERLHSAKHKAFTATRQTNLAGQHRAKSPENFGCPSCHYGKTLPVRLRVSLEEAKNTLAYFLFKFEEPKKINSSLMPDENCETCHHNYKGGGTSFHGMKAHIPKVNLSCISCHNAHAEGDADYYFMVEKDVVTACRKCHPHIPPSFRLNGKNPS
jgi:hypothetical protein